MPFRRWRYELWQGAALVRSGWRVSPGDAERALRAAVSRRVHELMGLWPLRPETARALDPFRPGAVVRIDCGAATCVLTPREWGEAAA